MQVMTSSDVNTINYKKKPHNVTRMDKFYSKTAQFHFQTTKFISMSYSKLSKASYPQKLQLPPDTNYQ